MITFHSIEIVQRAIILLKGQLKQEFIWNSLFAAKDRRIISAFLMLLEDFPLNSEDSTTKLVHFCCRHKICTGSLIRILGRNLAKHVETLFDLLESSNIPMLYELLLRLNLEECTELKIRKKLLHSIKRFIECNHHEIALKMLAKFLEMDSFAALPYQQFVLDSFYLEQTQKLAFKCIILSMNESNFMNVRQIIEQYAIEHPEEHRICQESLQKSYAWSKNDERV